MGHAPQHLRMGGELASCRWRRWVGVRAILKNGECEAADYRGECAEADAGTRPRNRPPSCLPVRRGPPRLDIDRTPELPNEVIHCRLDTFWQPRVDASQAIPETFERKHCVPPSRPIQDRTMSNKTSLVRGQR